jgi:hypothetical protein
MPDDGTYEQWIKSDPPPDLQALIRKAHERRAAQLGEPYDPRYPNHGGYARITPEEWAQWDADNAAWQARRRDRFRR